MHLRTALHVVLLGLSFIPAQASRAAMIFDGGWSVTATTRAGNCDRSFRFQLMVIDGRVLSGDVAGVSGRVTSGGGVTVRVHRGEGTVSGTGRLDAISGAGRWTAQSASGHCLGEWQARRVGPGGRSE
jgi:hypothetical protein